MEDLPERRYIFAYHNKELQQPCRNLGPQRKRLVQREIWLAENTTDDNRQFYKVYGNFDGIQEPHFSEKKTIL